MRSFLSYIVSALCITMAGNVTFADNREANTIYCDPAVTTLNAGDTGSIDILISEVVDLFGYQMEISFDAQHLDIVGVSEGPFLSNDGADQVFWINPTVIDDNIGLGTFTAAATRLTPGIGVSGDGVLFSISYILAEQVPPGTAINYFIAPSEVILSDPNAAAMLVGPVSGAVVNIPNNPPEISPPVFSEYDGDGDGVLEFGETALLVFSVIDDGGITDFNVDVGAGNIISEIQTGDEVSVVFVGNSDVYSICATDAAAQPLETCISGNIGLVDYLGSAGSFSPEELIFSMNHQTTQMALQFTLSNESINMPLTGGLVWNDSRLELNPSSVDLGPLGSVVVTATYTPDGCAGDHGGQITLNDCASTLPYAVTNDSYYTIDAQPDTLWFEVTNQGGYRLSIIYGTKSYLW